MANYHVTKDKESGTRAKREDTYRAVGYFDIQVTVEKAAKTMAGKVVE